MSTIIEQGGARRRARRAVVLAMAACVVAATRPPRASGSSDPCPPRYEVAAIIDGLDCGGQNPHITPFAINDRGDVVGYMYCPLGSERSFVWWNGGPLVQIEMPAGVNASRAEDINDRGWIVGEVVVSGQGGFGYVTVSGETTLLERLPDANSAQAYGVNNAGDIVGWCRNVVTGVPNAAVLWRDGRIVDLGSPFEGATSSKARGINAAGTIAGYSGAGINTGRAVTWSEEGDHILPPIPGGLTSEGQAINSDGSVVGRGRLTLEGGAIDYHGYLWTKEGAVDLTAAVGVDGGSAFGINDAGVVVGNAAPNTPFLWRDGTAWHLTDLVADPGAVHVKAAYDINNSGVIAGTASIEGIAGQFGVVLRPLPPIVGDLTCDGFVAFDDLLALLASWGRCSCSADLDGDGAVGQLDLSLLLDNWEPPT